MVLLSMMMMLILGITMQKSAEGFSFSSPAAASSSRTFSSMLKTQSPHFSRFGAVSDSAFDEATDDDDDDREREFAKVRRRKGRGGRYADDDDGYDDDDADRFRSGDDSVMDAADALEEEGFFDDLDDEDKYDDFDDEYNGETDESYDVFSNTVIPNPILDSIDPDGSAERFPELAADPKFWFDMFLFIAFLNFISFIGPRNPFPDVIPAMYTAGLPPPGL